MVGRRVWVWFRAGVAAAAAAVVLLAPSAAQAEQVFNVTTTTSGEVTNACNGESIAFEAQFHSLGNVTIDQAGGVHVVGETNIQGSGTGLVTGAKYEITGPSGHESFNVTGGAIEETVTFLFNAIGQGQVPNFLSQAVIHFTFDANGQPTATVSNVHTMCQ